MEMLEMNLLIKKEVIAMTITSSLLYFRQFIYNVS